jgi:hypothetical protein
MQVLAQVSPGTNFSQGVTLTAAQVLALRSLNIGAFSEAFRNGLAVQIRATFSNGVDAQKYFWSQTVSVLAHSSNPMFAHNYHLISEPGALDGGYVYPATRSAQSLQMSDTPTFNVTYNVTPTDDNGTWKFPPPNQALYDVFKSAFNTSNSDYAMVFITTLRRYKPNAPKAIVAGLSPIGSSPSVPGQK